MFPSSLCWLICLSLRSIQHPSSALHHWTLIHAMVLPRLSFQLCVRSGQWEALVRNWKTKTWRGKEGREQNLSLSARASSPSFSLSLIRRIFPAAVCLFRGPSSLPCFLLPPGCLTLESCAHCFPLCPSRSAVTRIPTNLWLGPLSPPLYVGEHKGKIYTAQYLP